MFNKHPFSHIIITNSETLGNSKTCIALIQVDVGLRYQAVCTVQHNNQEMKAICKSHMLEFVLF